MGEAGGTGGWDKRGGRMEVKQPGRQVGGTVECNM